MSGGPQRIILDPLLSLLYINDFVAQLSAYNLRNTVNKLALTLLQEHTCTMLHTVYATQSIQIALCHSQYFGISFNILFSSLKRN